MAGQEGRDRYTTEIVANDMQMLGGRGGGGRRWGGGGGAVPASAAPRAPRPAAAGGATTSTTIFRSRCRPSSDVLIVYDHDEGDCAAGLLRGAITVTLCARSRPMSGRYYIKTFGCQMNEYDSARMADVLRERAGLTADRRIRPRPTCC